MQFNRLPWDKMTLQEEFETLLRDAITSGGVANSVIKAAEAKLNVRFPQSYKVFLNGYGAALFNGFEIFGFFEEIRNDKSPPLWTNVVSATQMTRRASSGLIPDRYVAISNDGCDCSYYLDTQRIENDEECPVIALGPGIEGEVVAESFVDFLRRLISGN